MFTKIATTMRENLIFDIGMHVGEDTRFYLKTGFDVVAIEANPFLVEKSKKRFKKEIQSGQLRILNIGISNEEKIIPFYINHRLTEWSSFDKSIGSRNGTSFETKDIQCTTIEKVFEQYGIPFYMKVDIEGNDHFCLTGIPDNGGGPKYVSCESCSLEWLKILSSKGYTKFKMISQSDAFRPISLNKEKNKLFPKYQVIKNGLKLRVQKFINFKHEYGSSGPFAENTKGGWMTEAEVTSLFNAFYENNGDAPLNHVSWFDFHAKY